MNTSGEPVDQRGAAASLYTEARIHHAPQVTRTEQSTAAPVAYNLTPDCGKTHAADLLAAARKTREAIAVPKTATRTRAQPRQPSRGCTTGRPLSPMLEADRKQESAVAPDPREARAGSSRHKPPTGLRRCRSTVRPRLDPATPSSKSPHSKDSCTQDRRSSHRRTGAAIELPHRASSALREERVKSTRFPKPDTHALKAASACARLTPDQAILLDLCSRSSPMMSCCSGYLADDTLPKSAATTLQERPPHRFTNRELIPVINRRHRDDVMLYS